MNKMEPLILIVEDEPPLIEILEYNLTNAGFRTNVAVNGDEGLLQAQENNPDLIILDWMLPEMPGIEVCRKLRKIEDTKTIPIIMLTARSEETDRIQGLDSGADDYVIKPFSPGELIARIRAMLRRSGSRFGSEKLVFSNLEFNVVTHRVYRNGSSIHLGPTEFRLLQTLMERPKRVFSRSHLLYRVWGRDIYVEERTVDVHIRRLRKALNENGQPNLIRTVRGGGYSLDDEA